MLIRINVKYVALKLLSMPPFILNNVLKLQKTYFQQLNLMSVPEYQEQGAECCT